MRVLIAPDKFKGTMTARQAAAAMARGVRRVSDATHLKIEIVECPLADGGEGTLDILAPALRADVRPINITNADGERAEARLALFTSADGTAGALIESADAVGWSGIRREGSSPLDRTTFGLGECIAHAIDAGARDIIIALGGSATVDGGIGMAQALGWRFGPTPCGPLRGRDLTGILSAQPPSNAPREHHRFTALADVRHQLLGPGGAARVFGPQKGASPAQAEELEAGLTNLVKVCRGHGIACAPDAEGAGAAGGLGFGLATLFGARVVRGVEFVMDAVGFDERLCRADVLITGEGRLDAQSIGGKVVMGVAERAGRDRVPVLAVPGRIGASADELLARFAAAGAPLWSVTPATNVGLADDSRLASAAERALRAWVETRAAKP